MKNMFNWKKKWDIKKGLKEKLENIPEDKREEWLLEYCSVAVEYLSFLKSKE